MYVATGGAHRVRVFWIAYFLREHAAHFDSDVIYTSERAQDYIDEDYVLVQPDSRFDSGQRNLAFELAWSGSEFELFRVD